MPLIRINEVVDLLGVSSRTLRYYEEAGLLWSFRPDDKSQRHYDDAALERVKQIIVLRKLHIPVKDIAGIYKNESTAALIQAFVRKLESLDTEISALSELRRLVDDFLHKMLLNGITKISAITLLYEEAEKRFTAAERHKSTSYEKLSEISRKALKRQEVRIIRLPAARVLTSRLKTGQAENLDAYKMQHLFSEYGCVPRPGFRNCFFRKEARDEWIMLIHIPNDFNNVTEYIDEYFAGGLFAVACTYMEDMEDTFLHLREWIRDSDDFTLDCDAEGTLRCEEMIEEILPWDLAAKWNRYQQDVFVPIRLRFD